MNMFQIQSILITEFYTENNMAEEKTQENREDIIRVTGELKLINQKLDNHISHMSQKIDTIFRIVWTVSIMVLGLILKAIYTGLIN